MRGPGGSWLGTCRLGRYQGLFSGCWAGELLRRPLGLRGHADLTVAVGCSWMACGLWHGGLWLVPQGMGTSGCTARVVVSASVRVWVERSCPWSRHRQGDRGDQPCLCRALPAPATGSGKNLHEISTVSGPLVWGLMELLALALQPPDSSSLSMGCGLVTPQGSVSPQGWTAGSWPDGHVKWMLFASWQMFVTAAGWQTTSSHQQEEHGRTGSLGSLEPAGQRASTAWKVAASCSEKLTLVFPSRWW